ncbi:MAG TPA: hypothetical protein VD930_13035, partial [Gemmatimonadales bacterium]|nr:hypothetical protein [Gemmatimonadales bacterium]
DGDGELETSPASSLGSAGWSALTWDLTAAGAITAYNTNEPAFNDGDGILDTAGNGAKDIAFVGFLIEGGGSGTGTVTFDELSYSDVAPDQKEYKINEFRYAGSANEFVEIYGPAGAFPTNLVLRQYSAADATVSLSISLGGQTMPNDGGGFGRFVIGDPEVANVDFSTGFTSGSNNLSDSDPSSMQLVDAVNGVVYDSVVYEAFGGLDDLIRQQTMGVTSEGYAWLGSMGSTGYTMGRWPDGSDSDVNRQDFTPMPPTPGASNGDTVPIGTTFDFTSNPSQAYMTFQSSQSGAMVPGVGLSPSLGNAYRVIDITGGGQMAFIGDAGLGSGLGYRATGEIYIPASNAPANAVAIGIAGQGGTNFFTSTVSSQDSTSYEGGYWLIFENALGVGLADGRADHPGVFEFVHATNDNMDGTPVELLGSATYASAFPSLASTTGRWTTFDLILDPLNNRLVAKIGAATVYDGPIPAGGPTGGPFQVGFRENRGDNNATTDGTYIDNLSFTLPPATSVLDWTLLNEE